MPPPKVRLHKGIGSGKLKIIPRPSPGSSTSQGNSGGTSQNSSDSQSDQREAQEKFELELAWCIQRLEETLSNGKLNQKQCTY